MKDATSLSFDQLMEALAEKLASRLAEQPSRLYPRLLSLAQAAMYLGRSPQATQHLAASGKIPTVRADRRIFFDRLDLDRWVEENKSV